MDPDTFSAPFGLADAAPEPAGESRRGGVIYVGPNVTGAVHLARFTIFKNGELPAPVQAAAGSDPDLAALFVPVADLAQAQAGLRDPSSELAMAARRFVARQRRS